MLLQGILLGLALGIVVGVPLAWIEVKRQIRRTRAAERRARNAERLAETGAMTGGLAHEIKNPLSTMGLNAQLLAESLGELDIDPQERSRLIRRLDSIRREVERLRDILHDFLQFAGSIHLDLKQVNLNDVVDELFDFYLPQATHHGVRLRTDLSPHVLPVRMDVSHFKQAMLNLLINATQAMADEKHAESGLPMDLLLRTRAEQHSDLGPVCEVHVIDTGPGMSPERIQKIFTPYFTTKSGGSGLGLPTTKRLIEEHGGVIRVHSEPGKGTDMAISLPRAASAGG